MMESNHPLRSYGKFVATSVWARMGSNHGPRSYDEHHCEAQCQERALFVGRDGVEPSTSFLSGTRSTAEPTTQNPKTEAYFNITDRKTHVENSNLQGLALRS